MTTARRALAASALAVVALAAPAGSASASSENSTPRAIQQLARTRLPTPDYLSPTIFRPLSQTIPPPGFAINAIQAIKVSESTSVVKRARKNYPDAKPIAYISPLALRIGRFYHWDVVWYTHGTKAVAEAEMGAKGDVFETAYGPDVGWNLVRGYPGVLGQKLNAPYVWLPLCLIFLVPFFDPRRPFRLLHLDLLMLLLFGVSQFFFNLGKPWISVPLVYPFLAYVVGRMLFAAWRPVRRRGPLIPQVKTSFLIGGIVVALALRIVFSIADSSTFDIGSAGVIGADRIEHGLPLYVYNKYYGDTYGPVNYLMYIPAEAVYPFSYATGAEDAARLATLEFDLLTVLGLFVLGTRLRPGREGKRLGAALAFAWCTYPYTSLVIASNTNDSVVPLFVVWALVFLRSPPGRGLLTGLGGMTKFAPLLLAPVLTVGRGPFRLKTALISGGVVLLVCAGLIFAFLPDGGLTEFWKTTLGFQFKRESPLSIWVRHPSLDWLRPVTEIFAVGLAIASAFFPKRRTVGQVAALCAAILAAAQIPTNYWIYFYLVWFAPFVFIALFEEYEALGPDTAAQASVMSSFEKPGRMSQPESVTTTKSSILTPSEPGT